MYIHYLHHYYFNRGCGCLSNDKQQDLRTQIVVFHYLTFGDFLKYNLL